MGSHRLQQGDHAGDVLGVRVQWAAHRDAGVLEAGEMDHAADLVFGEDLIEEFALQDAAFVKGDVAVDEAAVTTGQVVDDDGWDAVRDEGAYHVGTDVAGAAGHQPGHLALPSPPQRSGGRMRRSVIVRSRTCSVAAIASPNRSSARTGCGSSIVTSMSVRRPLVIVFQLATRRPS